MTKSRGRSHTTTTETAEKVIKTLAKIPDIKMIAPGEISSKRAADQIITIRYTTAGCTILVCGNGIQKLNIHTTDQATVAEIVNALQASKKFKWFTIRVR